MTERPTRPTADPPLLVANARRPVPLQLLPVVVGLTLVFTIVAMLVPFTSQSPSGAMIQALIFMLCMGFLLLSPNGDRLEIFRVASLFYVFTFCIGDLFNDRRLVWFYASSYDDLLTRTSALALLCFVLMIVGYYLPVFSPVRERIVAHHERVDPKRVVPIALVFYGIGVASFAIFFVSAGGGAVILQGEGGVARGNFGMGVGIFFWPSLWMTSGGVMYFAAKASQRKRYKWIAAWPLALEFALLALLQGRHRALGPLLMGLVVSHYLIRPIRLPRLAVFAAAAAGFAMMLGVARDPSFRAVVVSNPLAAAARVGEDGWGHVRSLMTQDIGCVAKAMIIVDKVPAMRPYGMGESLFTTLNPVWRFVGLHQLQGRPVGAEAYVLARPELDLDPDFTTGILPSLVGEVRWNFPWPLATFWFAAYGFGLRLIYQRLIVQRSDFASVAIYATLGLYVVEMIFQSPTQNVFELLDIVLPMFLIRFLARRRVRRPGLSLDPAGSQAPTARGPLGLDAGGEMSPGASAHP